MQHKRYKIIQMELGEGSIVIEEPLSSEKKTRTHTKFLCPIGIQQFIHLINKPINELGYARHCVRSWIYGDK